jgi:hypothetical protein
MNVAGVRAARDSKEETVTVKIRNVKQVAALIASGADDCPPCALSEEYERNALVAAGLAELAQEGRALAQWTGPIGFENRRTGDGRMIEAGALVWDTPIPLMWAPQNMGAHQGAQVVGRINEITRDGDALMASGDFDLGSEVGREAYRQVAEGLTPGVSMDLDDISFEIRIDGERYDEAQREMEQMEEAFLEGDSEMPERPEPERDTEGNVIVLKMSVDDEMMVTTSARIRGATMVSVPAFREALITLGEDAESLALVASVTGVTNLPVADREREWDGQAALDRVFDFYTNEDGEVDVEGVSRAFLWRDDEADPTLRGSYSLGFADIVDSELRIVPRGVAATAGGRGVDATNIPESDKGRVRTRICSLYDQIRREFEDWPMCPFEQGSNASSGTALTASLTVQERKLMAPALPPRSWVEQPDLPDVTPLTVSDTGRVFGHIAAWGTCHTSYPGRCVTPPSSESNYAYFHTGAMLTEEGEEVAIGHLTVGTGHADKNMGPLAALEHYDNTGTTVAYVRAGEDAHGIWVAGTVNPTATEEQVRTLRASPMSGDWRRIGYGMELVGVLGVNVPGFPIPRTQAVVASGVMQSLVAAGMIAPREVIRPGLPGALSMDDLRYLKHLANAERERQRREAPASEEKVNEAAAWMKRVKVLAFANALSK